jgi:uncharacterized protein YwqG
MERNEIFNSFINAGMSKMLPIVQNILQESIRLNIIDSAQPFVLPASSHLGGLPDLPVGFTWPALKGIPMSFIAQVRLEDINGFEPAKKLPQGGLLSFFYDSKQDTYGGSPDDRGGWAVYYFDPQARKSLQSAAAPIGLPKTALFTASPLSFSRELTLPTSVAQHIDDLNWGDSEVQAYEDFLSRFPNNEDYSLPHHRMFGHPNQLQDDMQLQSALFFNGVTSIDDQRSAALAQKKEDWILLLQVDSDARTGMKWATSGMLYFWIHTASLENKKFDETWLVMQAE